MLMTHFNICCHVRHERQKESPFLVKLLKFSNSYKAYRIIKIKLKSLCFGRARRKQKYKKMWSTRRKNISMVMNYMMWKLKFNFETNFLRYFKSDGLVSWLTALKYLFTIFLGEPNVKIITELYSPSSQFNSFRD